MTSLLACIWVCFCAGVAHARQSSDRFTTIVLTHSKASVEVAGTKNWSAWALTGYRELGVVDWTTGRPKQFSIGLEGKFQSFGRQASSLSIPFTAASGKETEGFSISRLADGKFSVIPAAVSHTWIKRLAVPSDLEKGIGGYLVSGDVVRALRLPARWSPRDLFTAPVGIVGVLDDGRAFGGLNYPKTESNLYFDSYRPIVWDAHGSPTVLPIPQGFEAGYATAISRDGAITGVCTRIRGASPFIGLPDGAHQRTDWRPFLWRSPNSEPTPLPFTGSDNVDGEPTSINSSGWIGGVKSWYTEQTYERLGGELSRPLLWNHGSPVDPVRLARVPKGYSLTGSATVLENGAILLRAKHDAVTCDQVALLVVPVGRR
jgi:hypothetical protein